MVAPGIGSTPLVTTRVGMPSVCESTASNEVIQGALPQHRHRVGQRRPLVPVSASRGGRHGPPARPTSSIAALKYCTSLGVMSKRASGSRRR